MFEGEALEPTLGKSELLLLLHIIEPRRLIGGGLEPVPKARQAAAPAPAHYEALEAANLVEMGIDTP